jgi:RNA polymerase sigma factor (sigma-70 family)
VQLRDVTTAFADAVAAARPRVLAVVARLVGEDAEDVVQEAVLRAFLSLSQLRDPDRFESWLCGIAINVAKMRLRTAATEARVLAAAGTARPAEERELLEDVREALRLLPPRQRDAVLLHYVDGLSCDEVAAALDSTPGAVRVRLHRARAELRRRLAPHTTTPTMRREIMMVEMTLEDVVVRVDSNDPSKLVADQRIVVLREKDGGRVLPIWIGAGEGNALAVRLRDAQTPRPLTADLMSELVRVLGARVDRAAVTRLEDKTFYATLTIDGQELDARPSDAINLAVRTGAPIVVAPDVLDEAALLEGEPLDCNAEIDLAPGEWRSLSAELLASLYEWPR